jgi:hypothetical protein
MGLLAIIVPGGLNGHIVVLFNKFTESENNPLDMLQYCGCTAQEFFPGDAHGGAISRLWPRVRMGALLFKKPNISFDILKIVF